MVLTLNDPHLFRTDL